jgi:hypothetical protein
VLGVQGRGGGGTEATERHWFIRTKHKTVYAGCALQTRAEDHKADLSKVPDWEGQPWPVTKRDGRVYVGDK